MRSANFHPSVQQASILPPRLEPGGTIGICTPSWCGPALYPGRLGRGAEFLRGRGHPVRFSDHAFARKDYVAGDGRQRAQDLLDLFTDPQVAAVIASIGGDHCNQMLPFLDFSVLARHPKVLVGFSDLTVLCLALWSRLGLVTFHGPTVMTEFAEWPTMPDYSFQALMAVIGRPEPAGSLHPPEWWTDEHLDWDSPETATRTRLRQWPAPWVWLRPGHGRGALLGGCMESLQHLRATPFWPNWNGAILFLESSARELAPSILDAYLTDLGNMGTLNKLQGLVLGRFLGCTPERVRRLHQVVYEVVETRPFPVLANVDIGHTSPMLTLPIGVEAVLDSLTQTFAITGATTR